MYIESCNKFPIKIEQDMVEFDVTIAGVKSEVNIFIKFSHITTSFYYYLF